VVVLTFGVGPFLLKQSPLDPASDPPLLELRRTLNICIEGLASDLSRVSKSNGQYRTQRSHVAIDSALRIEESTCLFDVVAVKIIILSRNLP